VAEAALKPWSSGQPPPLGGTSIPFLDDDALPFQTRIIAARFEVGEDSP
jgi:hypothetical protein